MANVKITDLPVLTGASSASTDVLPVVDVSADTTSKMTRAEFFQNVPAITTTGSVGIGTTTPATKLHLSDTVPVYITMIDQGDGAGRIGQNGTAMTFGVDGVNGATERMRITNTGNVGIGTTTISQRLTVAGVEGQTNKINAVGTQYGSGAFLNAFTTAGGNDLGFSGFIASQVSNTTNRLWAGVHSPSGTNQAFVGTPDATVLALWTNSVERMRIDSSGNVGIGTSSPLAKVHSQVNTFTTADMVAYKAYNNQAVGVYANFQNSATGTAITDGFLIGINDSEEAMLINYEATAMAFSTSATERMRITSAGNVGIGNAAPVTPLHVTGASMTTGVVYKAQPAQTSKSVAATLTIAELLTGIIQYTGAAATLTLPTGTLIEGGLPATFPTDMSFDVSFINTGAALLTIGANGNTTVGTMTVATLTSAMLRFRKTAANTYTVYRIS